MGPDALLCVLEIVDGVDLVQGRRRASVHGVLRARAVGSVRLIREVCLERFSCPGPCHGQRGSGEGGQPESAARSGGLGRVC
jgi:hypothetical protein